MDTALISLLESTVGNYLLSYLKDAVVRQLRSGPDFEINNEDGSRVLLEVKKSVPGKDALERIAALVKKYEGPISKFVLVTPQPPNSQERKQFETVFSNDLPISVWVGVQDLPKELGAQSPGDFFSQDTLHKLQVASLIKNVAYYSQAPIGSHSPTDNAQATALSRQFSHRTLSQLLSTSTSLEEGLHFGRRVEQATVVLSDIVNFSSLVTASHPEDLQEAMGKYYRLAREAVFQHGGMLDKFIGDAVLAVFGYPNGKEQSAKDATKFALDLVNIGSEVLTEWTGELNAIINTGTRVGIATGDLWPINIGSTEVEITLLGDTINLAARLEKNSPVDRFLMDHKTKKKLAREDDVYLSTLALEEVEISQDEAKGQAFPIRAWRYVENVG